MVKLEPTRCLYAFHRNVQCEACAVACPRQALTLDGGPVVDATRCDDCGRCVPACTEGALDVGLPEPELRTIAGEHVAFTACAHSEVQGPLPCLHSLDWARLQRAHARGVRRWLVASAPCDSCPRRPTAAADTLDARLAALDVISRSRGQGAVKVEQLEPAAWRTHRRHATPEPARRALFRWLLPDAGHRPLRLGLAAPTVPTAGILAAPADVAAPGPIGRFAVAIDAQRCSGCLACAGVCPHRALTVETDARGTACALVVEAEACTGCRLCEVACDDAALTVHSLAAQRAARLELTPVACPSCREVHHRPAASTVRCARRAPSPRVLVLKDSP